MCVNSSACSRVAINYLNLMDYVQIHCILKIVETAFCFT